MKRVGASRARRAQGRAKRGAMAAACTEVLRGREVGSQGSGLVAIRARTAVARPQRLYRLEPETSAAVARSDASTTYGARTRSAQATGAARARAYAPLRSAGRADSRW